MNNAVYAPCFTHLMLLREGTHRAVAIHNTLISIRQLGKLRRHVLSLIHPPMLPPTNFTCINVKNTVLTSPVFDPHDIVHLTVVEHYIVMLIQFVKKDFAMFKSTTPPYYTVRWHQKLDMWAEWSAIEQWFGFSGSTKAGDNGWYDVALAQLWERVHKRVKRIMKSDKPREAGGKQLMNGLKRLWNLRHRVSLGTIPTAKIALDNGWEDENMDLKWPGVG